MISRLRKMIAQEDSEASIRMPSTIWTGMLACKARRMTESCSPIHTGSCNEKIRQALRPQRCGIDARDSDIGLHEQPRSIGVPRGGCARLLPIDPLREAHRHGAFGARLTGDDQLVIQTRRLAIVDTQTD